MVKLDVFPLQIYVPSFLIVVVSWISFWLNKDKQADRVGLGVTTVLTITLLLVASNDAMPKISYLKAIDIYLAACFIMVFMALLGMKSESIFSSLFDHKFYRVCEHKLLWQQPSKAQEQF